MRICWVCSFEESIWHTSILPGQQGCKTKRVPPGWDCGSLRPWPAPLGLTCCYTNHRLPKSPWRHKVHPCWLTRTATSSELSYNPCRAQYIHVLPKWNSSTFLHKGLHKYWAEDISADKSLRDRILTTFTAKKKEKKKKLLHKSLDVPNTPSGSNLLMASSQWNWAHPIIHLFWIHAQVRMCYLFALLVLWPSDYRCAIISTKNYRACWTGGSISIRKGSPAFCHASWRQAVVSVTICGTTICPTEHASLFIFNYQTGLEDRTTRVFCLGEQ